MPTSPLLQFFSGLIFFFFGLYTISQGLNFFAGERLKNMVARTSLGPVRSLFTGIVVTFFLQSSSAVTVMTSSLAGSGLIKLEQAMAIALGAGVGTTFVVLLISIKSIVISGVFLVAIGLLVRITASRQNLRIVGDIILGFGLVFFGMKTMGEGSAYLSTQPWVPSVFAYLAGHPLGNFLIAAAVTGLVHSSGVVLGILISLAYSGGISFETAFPFILGANVGSALTAIMATLKAPANSKRAAWANFLLRAGAVVMMYPFLGWFGWLFKRLSEGTLVFFNQPVALHNEIALIHLYFNLCVALVFFPFLKIGKKLVVWLIPDRDVSEVFAPKYLDKNALSTPPLAFAQARRELIRMGEIVQGMLRESLSLFKHYDNDKVAELMSRDHKVDLLYKAIKFYIAKLSQSTLKHEEAGFELHLITAVGELENIGDMIDRHVLRLAHKKWNKGVSFSEEGWKELMEVHQKTCDMFDLGLAALATNEEEVARKMVHQQLHFKDREDEIKLAHLKRLHLGLKESIETSAIHLELISLFHGINAALVNMVGYLLPEKTSTDIE